MKCHDNQMLDSSSEKSPKGIPVFAIPGIDIETLNRRNLSIGYWPNSGRGHDHNSAWKTELDGRLYSPPEGLRPGMAENQMGCRQLQNKNCAKRFVVQEGISPFMKFLLSAEPQNADALNAIAGLNLLNLSDANISQLQAVKKLVWAIKELLYEISTKGHQALTAKIQKAAGKRIDSEQLAMLSELLPMELFQQSVQKWFGTIEAQNPAHKPKKTSSNENSRDIHWERSATVNKKLNFLKFSHLPHSTVSSEKGCKFCHKLPTEGKNMESNAIKDTNPIDFVSVKMSTCIACHVKIKYEDNCLDCHIYHIKEI